MDRELLKHKIKHNTERTIAVFKWIIFSLLMGAGCGLIGALFQKGVLFVTEQRMAHPFIMLLLPVGAIAIVFFYRRLGDKKDPGTNLILDAIHSGEVIPLRMSVLIFFSTIFSHLCGASVGREGAALQIGGSIGQNVGKLFRFDSNDRNTITMCGMSAVFSALFGTPVAAAFFSMEVVSVGIMHYAALVPCAISSIMARFIASLFGVEAPHFDIPVIAETADIRAYLLIALTAALAGLVSILFVLSLHGTAFVLKKITESPYLKAFLGGSAILLLTALLGFNTQTFNGAGVDVIRDTVENGANWYDFLLKMLFTAICLSCGYKGGEIVPAFFIGASFGAFFGGLVGLPIPLSAAIGMCALFVGITNCPVTGLLIAFELFGMGNWPFFLLTVAISYVVSGYFGVYKSQTIVYSKFHSNYINKNTHQ